MQITDDRTVDWSFSLDASNLVWSASVNGAPTDIFFFDGLAQTVTRVTDDFAANNNPDVSGSIIAWSRRNVGESDAEIYLTNVPEPSSALATSSALLALLLLSRYRASRKQVPESLFRAPVPCATRNQY